MCTSLVRRPQHTRVFLNKVLSFHKYPSSATQRHRLLHEHEIVHCGPLRANSNLICSTMDFEVLLENEEVPPRETCVLGPVVS